MERIATLLLLGTLFVYGFWAAAVKWASADLWWALAAGRYIVQHGGPPPGDVLSYTFEGTPWLNGEWLSEAFYFELWQLGGGLALAAFKFAAVMSTMALAAWVGWRRSGSLVLAVGTAALAAAVSRSLLDIRSQLFFFLCALGSIAILDAYRRGARSWVLGWIPLLLVLWVNLHYSFTYGIGILGLYTVSEAAKSWLSLPTFPMSRDRVVTLAWVSLVAIAAAVVLNPFHLDAFLHPLAALGTEAAWRDEIVEWLPPVLFVEQLGNPVAFSYLLVLQLVVSLAALVFCRKGVDLTDALLFAVTTAMALTARRFIPLFAFVGAPFMAQNLALLGRRALPASWLAEPSSTRRSLAIALLALLASGLLLMRAVPEVKETFAPGIFEGLNYTAYFPQRAAEFLRLNSALPARLFNFNTWGGYLAFEVPERKIFIDGRAQLLYPYDFYLDSVEVELGNPKWSDVLDRWQVSLVVFPSESFSAGSPMANGTRRFAKSLDWLRIYDDDQAAVFAHIDRGSAWIDALRAGTLQYPDGPDIPLMLGKSYLASAKYDLARTQLESLIRRYPDKRSVTQSGETTFLRMAQSDNSAVAWFGLGFYRDLDGNREGAIDAFNKALERGLGGNEAAFARKQLAQLTAPPGEPKESASGRPAS